MESVKYENVSPLGICSTILEPSVVAGVLGSTRLNFIEPIGFTGDAELIYSEIEKYSVWVLSKIIGTVKSFRLVISLSTMNNLSSSILSSVSVDLIMYFRVLNTAGAVSSPGSLTFLVYDNSADVKRIWVL